MDEIFRKNGVYLSDESAEKFKVFADLLEKFNALYNITAIKSGEETYIKHFFDSVKGERFFKENSSVIEIGSGGGFPSVPLMIVRGDLKFTLVESTLKKCEFLEKARQILKLNCVIINERAEILGKSPEYREKFDHATARAVAKLNILSEYCLPFVKKGGSFIAYKAKAEEETEEAKNAVNILGGKITEKENYDLPKNMGERTIIKIEKISLTPKEYPRGNGKERKKPL